MESYASPQQNVLHGVVLFPPTGTMAAVLRCATNHCIPASQVSSTVATWKRIFTGYEGAGFLYPQLSTVITTLILGMMGTYVTALSPKEEDRVVVRLWPSTCTSTVEGDQ